jgi:tetratricopeptide (TPR) repeat protein
MQDPAAKIIGSVIADGNGEILINDEVRALVVTNYGNALRDHGHALIAFHGETVESWRKQGCPGDDIVQALKAARDQYLHAVEINNPSFLDTALAGVGTICSFLYGGHDKRTIAARRRNVRACPKSPVAMYNLGVSLRCKAQSRGDFEEAIGVLRKAKKINPRDADVYALLGECLLMRPDGSPKETKQELEAALKLDPHHPKAKELLTRCHSTK